MKWCNLLPNHSNQLGSSKLQGKLLSGFSFPDGLPAYSEFGAVWELTARAAAQMMIKYTITPKYNITESLTTRYSS